MSTAVERSQLYAAEEKIEKHIDQCKRGDKAQRIVGEELERIAEGDLYLSAKPMPVEDEEGNLVPAPAYKNFEDYCQRRWGITRMHAWRLRTWAKDYKENVTSGYKTPPESLYESRRRREIEGLAQELEDSLIGAPPEEQAKQIERAERETIARGEQRRANDADRDWICRCEELVARLLKLCRKRVGTEAAEAHFRAGLEELQSKL